MPRYTISISSGAVVIDTCRGVFLPNLTAARHLIRQRLVDQINAAAINVEEVNIWADVLDDNGDRVLATKLTMQVVEP